MALSKIPYLVLDTMPAMERDQLSSKFRPYRGYILAALLCPTARAVGYDRSPLPGLHIPIRPRDCNLVPLVHVPDGTTKFDVGERIIASNGIDHRGGGGIERGHIKQSRDRKGVVLLPAFETLPYGRGSDRCV